MTEHELIPLSIDDVLRLTWREQSLGKREDVQQRLAIVDEYIEKWMPVIDGEQGRLANMAIDESTSNLRMGYAEARYRLDKAHRAKKILNRELLRRGVVDANS